MSIGADANDSFIIEEASTFVFETLPHLPRTVMTVPGQANPA